MTKRRKTHELAQPATRSWRVHFFQRHRDDDPVQSVPVREYLDACPVAARLVAVAKAVADAPPPAFSGGGKMDEPFRSTFSDGDYAWVRRLGDEYERRNPRSVAT